MVSCLLGINPIALRKAKIVCNFGLSECSRVQTGISPINITTINQSGLIQLKQDRSRFLGLFEKKKKAYN